MARVKWRAVVFGVAVEVLVLFGAVLVPLVGHAAVGLAGGFVGGVLAGGGPRPGARHGLVVGAAGAVLSVVVAAALAVAGVLDDVVFTPVLAVAIERGVGVPALTVAGAVALVALSGVAGLLGGQVRGTREFPGRKQPGEP
ncbi:MAG: hypothetical protein ABEJ70_08400 [Halobacteriaceae archaeon]